MAERSEPASPDEGVDFNLLFVCSGNTCRSPMAATLARRQIQERGYAHVSVRSAGLFAGVGEPATEEARHVIAEVGLDLSDHASSAVTSELLDWADMILVMSPSHLAVLEELGVGAKSSLVTEFLDGEGAGVAVEDPIGADETVYRRTRDQLARAIEALLERLRPILAP